MKALLRRTTYFPLALLLFALVLAGCFQPPGGTEAGYGTLSVTSEPADARVFLNGEDTGETTPDVFENLAAGTYSVTVRKTGLEEQTETVRVTRGDVTEVSFTLVPADGSSVPSEVHGVNLLAVTYSVDLGIFRQQRQQLFEAFGLAGNPNWIDLGDGLTVDTSSLLDDITAYTVIRWDEVPGASGYIIERATAEDGPWELVERVQYNVEPNGEQDPYIDFKGEFGPGRRLYYRVRAVGPNGAEGRASVPVWVEHLAPFEVHLSSPADNEVDVPLLPTFTWTSTDVGADSYIYSGFVAAVTGDPEGLEDFIMWEFEVNNKTGDGLIEYGDGGELYADLRPAKTYSWNLYDARAANFYRADSTAIAISGPNIGAVNGEFTFTTVTER